MGGQLKWRIFAFVRIFAILKKPDLRVSPLVFRVSGNHLLRWESSTRFNDQIGHEIHDGVVVVNSLYILAILPSYVLRV